MRNIAGILLIILLCLSVPAAAEDSVQQNRALLIGVDLFVSQQSTYPSSANNIQDVYKTLQNSILPFETIFIPERPVTSKAMLADWVQEAFGDADANDLNYLYISTHGDYDPNGNAVLLLSDGKTEEALTAQELEAMLSDIEGVNLILMDACFSGAFIGKGMRRQPHPLPFHSPRCKVLTSSGAMEASWYWNGQKDMAQGSFYFTQSMTQGLSPRWGYPADRNRNGEVTLEELYNFLLQNHGASTPQVYPQVDDTVIFAYDPDTEDQRDRAAVVDVVFEGDSMQPDESLTLSYTVLRPVRVAYQIVYRRDGEWQFNEAELYYDDSERYTAFGELAGAMQPGRKRRTISLKQDVEDLYGYVLVQLLSMEGGQLTVQTGHVIAITPSQGELQMAVTVPEHFELGDGAELPIFIEHSYPCALSVKVVGVDDETVARLSYRAATRPLGIVPDGSCYYWNGTDRNSAPVPQGEYRIVVEGWMGDAVFTAQSKPIAITHAEEETGL